MWGELSSEWGELSSECGASILWGELSLGELSLGRVVRNPLKASTSLCEFTSGLATVTFK